MGKTLRKVAEVVAIGALVVGTMGAGAAFWAGYSAAGLGGAITAIRSISFIATAFRIAAFAGAISATLNKPKINIDEATQQRTQLSLMPSPPRKWVFGLTAASMDMIYAEVYGTNSESYTVVIAHAGHLIESYQRLWIDGELVTWSGNNATGRWAGLLTRQQRLGGTSQTAITINAGSRWTSSEHAYGVAIQALFFTVDQEKNPRGLPTRIVQEIEGSPVYDPRLDTTEGGTGSHRADDQTTWEYSNAGTDIGRNAALVYLTYLIGWRDSSDIVLGVGIPVDDVLYDTFIEAANICEANDWFFDGVLSDGDNHGRNLRSILNSMAGEPIEVGGKFGVRAPFDDTATVALAVTGDRIMGQVYREGSPPFVDRINIARGRYVEPDNAYQPEEYAAVELSDLVTIDGSELPTTIDFPGTSDPDTAQQLAGVMLREMRQPIVRSILDQTALAVQPGEIISITLAEAGLSTTLVRVKRHNFNFENMSVAIEGRVVVSTDYDLVTPSTAASKQTPSLSKFDELIQAVNLSGLTAVAATISTLYGTITSTERYGFALSWDDPGVQILETQIQYKPTAESGWINAPSAIGDTNGTPNTAVISGIEADTDYDIRARHLNLHGFPGDWNVIQESSSVTTLNPPTNLTLSEELVFGSDGQYKTQIILDFDKPDDLHIHSFEARYRFVPRDGSTYRPLFDSDRNHWEVEVSQIGQYVVQVRSVYIPGILVSSWVEATVTAGGTNTGITAIGIEDPLNPDFYVTLNRETGIATIRIEVSYDKASTNTYVEPEFLVVFYAVDDVPNQLTLGTDSGLKLYLAGVTVESTYTLTVAAGSTVNQIKADLSTFELDMVGTWWAQVQSGTNGNTRYFKVVRATTDTLYINAADELPYVPGAGDTLKLVEISFHDGRAPEFKLAYVDGEVIKHQGIDYDGSYYLDVVTRGVEGTSQATQTGKKLNYYPAFGVDTKQLIIPVEDFKYVDGILEYSNNVGMDLPAEFAWAAISCCFVRRSTDSEGIKWVRSNIVPLTFRGKA